MDDPGAEDNDSTWLKEGLDKESETFVPGLGDERASQSATGRRTSTDEESQVAWVFIRAVFVRRKAQKGVLQ